MGFDNIFKSKEAPRWAWHANERMMLRELADGEPKPLYKKHLGHYRRYDDGDGKIKTSPERLVRHMLRLNAGLALGEYHNDIPTLQFMINLMPLLKECGVDTIYSEFFEYWQQPVIDKFYQDDNGRPLIAALRRRYNHEISDAKKESERFYIGIVAAAKKQGIRFVALDISHDLGWEFMKQFGNEPEVTRVRNRAWTNLIENDRKEQSGKFAIHCGMGHMAGIRNFKFKRIGVDDMLKIPSIAMIDYGDIKEGFKPKDGLEEDFNSIDSVDFIVNPSANRVISFRYGRAANSSSSLLFMLENIHSRLSSFAHYSKMHKDIFGSQTPGQRDLYDYAGWIKYHCRELERFGFHPPSVASLRSIADEVADVRKFFDEHFIWDETSYEIKNLRYLLYLTERAIIKEMKSTQAPAASR